MTYRHPYTTTFYNSYTLISVIIVKVTVIYVCPPSHFSDVTWIFGERILSEHSKIFKVLEGDKTVRLVSAI